MPNVLYKNHKTFDSWKPALVQAIPKKGDRPNSSTYRSIALSSAISKIFKTLTFSPYLGGQRLTVARSRGIVFQGEENVSCMATLAHPLKLYTMSRHRPHCTLWSTVSVAYLSKVDVVMSHKFLRLVGHLMMKWVINGKQWLCEVMLGDKSK